MVEGERAEGEVVGCGCGGGEHDGGSGDQGGAAGRQKRSHGGSFTACGSAAVGPAPAAEDCRVTGLGRGHRSEEHTSELQSLMRKSYSVFCLKKKQKKTKDRQSAYNSREE